MMMIIAQYSKHSNCISTISIESNTKFDWNEMKDVQQRYFWCVLWIRLFLLLVHLFYMCIFWKGSLKINYQQNINMNKLAASLETNIIRTKAKIVKVIIILRCSFFLQQGLLHLDDFHLCAKAFLLRILVENLSL